MSECVCGFLCIYACVLWSNINASIINERPLRPRAQNAYICQSHSHSSSLPCVGVCECACICLCILWLTASVICHWGDVFGSGNVNRPGGLSQYQSPPVANASQLVPALALPSFSSASMPAMSVSNGEKPMEINGGALRR